MAVVVAREVTARAAHHPKEVREVLEEAATFTSAIKEILPTMDVSLGPKTFSEVSRSTEWATS